MKQIIINDTIRVTEDPSLKEVEHWEDEHGDVITQYFRVPNIYKFLFAFYPKMSFEHCLDACFGIAKVYLENYVESRYVTITITPIPHGTD